MTAEAPGRPAGVPRPGQHLPALDGVRGVAILLVLLTHCLVTPEQGAVAWLIRNSVSIGWVGVDLFFVLSGFLITGILMRSASQPHSLRDFATRRMVRILPLYASIVALVLLAAPVLPFGPRGESWPYLAFVSNLWDPLYRLGVLTDPHPHPALAHTWSLSIEAQFYVVFPLIVRRFDRRRLAAILWTILALMPVARLVTNAVTVPGESYFVTWCRLDPLAMGALVALMLDQRSTIEPAFLHRARLMCAGLLAASAVLLVTRQISFARAPFNAIGLTIVDGALASLILLVVVRGAGWLDALLGWRPLAGLGTVSYGVYMIHYPVLLLALHVLPAWIPEGSWPWTLGLAVAGLGSTLVLAVLSWRFFEQPMLRRSKPTLIERTRFS